MRFGLFLILIMISLAINIDSLTNDCDWKVDIISNDIFDNKEDFEFKYKIERISGNKTNVTLIRWIEDINKVILKDYDNYTKEITNQHTTTILSPNLDEGIYLIKGKIFPECNDDNLEDNLKSKLVVILPEKFDQDYTKLKINEFLPDPIWDDNSQMPNGEFVEIYNPGGKSLDLNGLYLSDDVHKLKIDDTHTTTTIIQPNGFLTVYMNGFSGLLNNDEDKIKLYYNNSLIDEVYYSNSKEGLSWSKIGNYWKLLTPSPNQENIDEVLFNKGKSIIKIENIYLGNDNEASFGDEFEVRLEIYKGNTSKNAIEAWVENKDNKISRVTNFNIYGKFQNYTINIPLALKNNCDYDYEDGKYSIIVDGIDSIDKKEIKVNGINEKLCNIKKEKETKKEVNDVSYELLEIPNEVNASDEVKIKLKINNNSTEGKNIEISSYIYKGRNMISQEKEIKKLNIPSQGSAIIDLDNKLDLHTLPGEYKLKINFKEENKRADDFTTNIKILENEIEEENLTNKIQGRIIYESSDLKTKNSIQYILIILLAIVIFAIFRKGL